VPASMTNPSDQAGSSVEQDCSGAPPDSPGLDPQVPAAVVGSSPYSTGGGGVTFGQLVSSVYLASMITGDRRSEAAELSVRSVAYQAGPEHPVDDILVACGDRGSSMSLAVACRATPDFVQSDAATVKLVGSLLSELELFEHDSHHVVVATAGRSKQWDDLATLCDVARVHSDHLSLRASLEVPGRWSRGVRTRFSQLQLMVVKAEKGVGPGAVLERTWRLLRRLHVISFLMQSPDDRDRTAVATSLDSVARSGHDGISVRDSLESLASRYDRMGGVVDATLLRRDLHPLLADGVTRSRGAWEALANLRALALSGVRNSIGEGVPGGAFAIPLAEHRKMLANALTKAATSGSAVLVSGESGTGKSALTLSVAKELQTGAAGALEAVILNFRSLPQTGLELRSILGSSIEDTLAEVSAPQRILVVDAADTAMERSSMLLAELLRAARSADLGVAVVAAEAAADFTADQLGAVFGSEVERVPVSPLGDEDVAAVAGAFPRLRGVLTDLPKKSLLRRLVVLDLLARTGAAPTASLGEWDCLQLIWSKVVRGDGRPENGSPESRERTLIALAAHDLRLPGAEHSEADPTAVDALRRHHLLAPWNPYTGTLEFAHDEVRRYATAFLLLRAGDMVELLESAPTPRPALSAATLACKARLLAPTAQSVERFPHLLERFESLAAQRGLRWADVPVEAVLETPDAHKALRDAIRDGRGGLKLEDVLRVVRQRHQTDGILASEAGGQVVRLLLDYDEPWEVSDEAFELLADWLTSLVLSQRAPGNELRVALRGRLLTYWNSFPSIADRSPRTVPAGGLARRRRRREIDYHLCKPAFVETLALLGPDIDNEVETNLRTLAALAPGDLAPAVDSPLSARAVAQRAPELLAELMEAYYVGDDGTWVRAEGVREHRGRWKGFGPPFSAYYFGGFWVLFNSASVATSVRVLNGVLNSGANARMRRSGSSYGEEREEDSGLPGAMLDLDGTPRLYVGDSHVWAWYRGTSVGPYPAMSALQAMERVAESWLNAGAPPRVVVQLLLAGCENLAVPGLLFGLLFRHSELLDDELDVFLAEPAVWELEFTRNPGEHMSRGSQTEGLKDNDRRRWTPYQIAAWLVANGGPDRAVTLKQVAEKLTENGTRLGVSGERVLRWAASLDADRYRVTRVPEGLSIEVEPPAELEEAQREHARRSALIETNLRLQNRYWGSPRFDADHVPPRSEQIAADLVVGRQLLDVDASLLSDSPADSVAHVVDAAVARAVHGDLTALGEQSEFALRFVLRISARFEGLERTEDDQLFDLGADRAAAHTLPAYLTPFLRASLLSAGVAVTDIGAVGLAVARNSSIETQLYLARGCDVVWAATCEQQPCIHQVALGWLEETARWAEIGPWEPELQAPTRPRIAGSVVERVYELSDLSIDVAALNALVRGLGAAASTSHCCTDRAQEMLRDLVRARARAMIAQEEAEYTADHQGNNSAVTARALLQMFAEQADAAPTLEHVDRLRADAQLFSNFLHGLAGAGAENSVLADAARGIWPVLVRHCLQYAEEDQNPFADHSWGRWSAAALLPEPTVWSQGIHNECKGSPIDWVRAEDFVDLVPQWLSVARGDRMCLDHLVNLIVKLSPVEQARQGLPFVEGLCIAEGRATFSGCSRLDTWLKEIRSTAEECALLEQWQVIVDALVVAGNQALAPFSR